MLVLDMDSSESPTYGEQEGSAYNGHFGCTCYHPIFVFNQFGDVERWALRPGNVHSAVGWRAVLDYFIVATTNDIRLAEGPDQILFAIFRPLRKIAAR
jgi:Transposase DDE domain group 1